MPIDILDLIGRTSDDEVLEQFLIAQRIHDRPKTIHELQAEGYLDDDEDIDIEYELAQASEDSMIVESERLGICLIFKRREDYALVNGNVPPGEAPFILYEAAFFAQDVQIYQQYQGILPGGFKFGIKRNDPRFQQLGPAIATRTVYETSVDLFVMDGWIVNYGFKPEDEFLAYARVRKPHQFDAVMLNPKIGLPAVPITEMTGGALIGQQSSSPEVQNFLRANGIEMDDYDDMPGSCPEEITQLTHPLGMTLYVADTPQGQRVSSIAYKRRGDLGSQGYTGPLPMGFQFGDAPQTLQKKAGRKHIKRITDDQLESFFWLLESGHLVQAVCSLIDWQLYRIVVFAPFCAKSVLNA